jgi:tetratricopeptide (TPR) repeat protein
MIQTSAAISPGSSGGGLFDRFGALVGITEYSLRDSQNLNFAIPAEAVTYFEDTQKVFLERGSVLASAKNPQAADQCAKAARVSSDQYQYALAQLCFSDCYVQTGQLQRAEQLAKDALKTYQGFPHAHFILGLLYEKAGKREEAASEYQAASRLDPSNQSYADAFIRVRKQTGPAQVRKNSAQ